MGKKEANPVAVTIMLTATGLVINFLLAFVKFIVGVSYSSHALIADAFHSITDSVTDIIIIFGVRFWNAPADSEHPYGHGRIEAVVSLLLGLILAAAAVGLGYQTLFSLYDREIVSNYWPVFSAACLSLLLKEFLFQWHWRSGRRLRSGALMANAWHHRSDALSSLVVAISSIVSWQMPDWGFLDQVAALIVVVFILQAAWNIIRPAFQELIDTGANDEKRDRLVRLAKEVEGVMALHALRTRRIGAGMRVDLHVQVDAGLSVLKGHAIAGAVKARIMESEADVTEVLIHIEPHATS
jgi:cation diffusion facilitator family transporter